MTESRAPRTLEYSILDVFAERPLEGNPLAVFHDARSLSGAEMQALARETNLAETTFVLPDEPEQERSEGVRVRIFTTVEELPFAGHPTLGTASWLYLHHPLLRGADVIQLRLNGGPVAVRFAPAAGGELGVQGAMQQKDPVFGATHDRAAVAQALGLAVDDLSPEHAPQTVSTGLPFCIVPLRALEVSRRLRSPAREAQAWLSGSDAKFFYCVAPLPPLAGPAEGQPAPLRSRLADAATLETDAAEAARSTAELAPRWHARMQFYHGEDPATGSAAGCFISWLVRHGLAASGERVVVEQGLEIQRPSRIVTSASLRNGRVVSVMVAGRTIPVAEGRLFLS